MPTNPVILSRALFGGELEGDKLVRFIYVDEAGISVNEPVTVVVGLIIHADTQWRLSESELKQTFEAVPKCYRQNFIFHAKEIWGSKKYRESWDIQDRLAFLYDVMSIPKRLNIPLVLSIAHRNASYPLAIPESLPKEQFQHAAAFMFCMAKADAYLKRRAEQNEVATIIAEDVPRWRRFLRALLPLARDRANFPDAFILKKGEKLNAIEAHWNISRIIDTIHFTEKAHAPLLQLADACAYGFRRYFSKQSHGEDFAKAISGGLPNLEDFSHPLGSVTAFCDG
jgi:hypothetical protein